MKYFQSIIILFSLILSFALHTVFSAPETHCQVCNMTIPQNAKNLIVLSSEKTSTLKVCSIPCVQKAKKNNFKYTSVEIADFNHPEKLLDGNKAFFIVNSKKIKAELGEMAMPPYLAAFATKKEAETLQKKHGDGTIVQGFEEALKATE